MCWHAFFWSSLCDIVAIGIVIHRTVNRSIDSISSVFIIGVFLFVIIMDALKYVFKVDPVKRELKKLKQKPFRKKAQHIRVNALPKESISHTPTINRANIWKSSSSILKIHTHVMIIIRKFYRIYEMNSSYRLNIDIHIAQR